MELLLQFGPLIVVQGVYAFIVYLYASKLRISPILPVVLCMIPIFGMLYFAYFLVRTMLTVLDRLQALSDKVDAATFS